MSEAVVVIPARYGSTRLPGKPLLSLAGKPMIQWVYERASEISPQIEILVATDDQRIADVVRGFGGTAVLTPESIATGSERVGYAVSDMDAEIVVNLQGDEPLISPEAVATALKQMQDDATIKIATLGTTLKTKEEWLNPSVVKVLVDENGDAIYFSRAAIPFHRDDDFSPYAGLMRHLGVYLYQKSFLMDYLSWPESPLEKREKLEQLRILEKGYRIRVVPTEAFSPGVDTPDDINIVESLLKERGYSK